MCTFLTRVWLALLELGTIAACEGTLATSSKILPVIQASGEMETVEWWQTGVLK